MKVHFFPFYGNFNQSYSLDIFQCLDRLKIKQIGISHFSIKFPNNINAYDKVVQIRSNFAKVLRTDNRVEVGNQQLNLAYDPILTLRIRKDNGLYFTYNGGSFYDITDVDECLRFYFFDLFENAYLRDNLSFYLIVAIKECE